MPLLLAGLIILGLFLVLFFQERRRLFIYFMLGIALLIIGMYLFITLVDFIWSATNSEFIRSGLVTAFIIVLLLILFVLISIPFSLIINGGVLVQKEGFKISNLLSILLGVGVIGYLVISNLFFSYSDNKIIVAFFDLLTSFFAYLVFFIFLVLFATFIYLMFPTRKKVDYIIILGSGLINNKVTPLLAGRLKRAIKYNERQYKKHKEYAKYLVSGGQGSDENLPEAVAMEAYLIEQGIPAELILVEDQSTNTKENLLYSQRLIEENTSDYKAIFATSNYHVFRTALLAKRLNFNVNGVGSRTAWYFLPNAMIRELVAITLIYKNWHIIYLALQILTILGNLIATM